MSLSDKDRRMFEKYLKRIEIHIDDLQLPLLNCAPVEWMLLPLDKETDGN